MTVAIRMGFALILAVGVGTVSLPSAEGSSSQRVTLKVERFLDPACTPLPGYGPQPARGGCPRLRFSGSIASGARNKYVSVLYASCGSRGLGTSHAGALTGAGGSWEAIGGVASGTFRARSGASLSRPVRFRDTVPLLLTRVGPLRQRVTVSLRGLEGRRVELQQLASGRWKTLRRARLVRWHGSSSATFSVRRQGLIFRVFVPAKSAAPCYAPTASEQWTSGAQSGSAVGAASRVIDRTYSCLTAMQGGIRVVSLSVSGRSGSGAAQIEPSLRAFSGSAQDADLAAASSDHISAYRTRCTLTRERVSLAPGRLRGGTVGLSRTTVRCEAPPRIVVRVRAAFRAPVVFEPSRPDGLETLTAQGEVSEAAVAVRTPGGKRLAFADFAESGKARLHAARHCLEE